MLAENGSWTPMTRLDKKCFVASAGVHTTLMLILLVAPMIWVSRNEVSLPMLTFIPSRLVDGAMSAGGGSPTAASTPAPTPPVERPVPIPQVPKPAPIPEVKPKPEPAPVKQLAKAQEPVKPAKPAKRKIEVSLERDTTPSKAKPVADTEAKDRAAQKQIANRINALVGTLGQRVSSGTAIDIPGPGGAAFADYGQWVVKVYYEAWSPPSDLADDLATVTATVVIRRDGTVESFRILKRSGHSALDQSVKRLENVGFVAKFPDGALDPKRTFIIDFNLRSKL